MQHSTHGRIQSPPLPDTLASKALKDSMPDRQAEHQIKRGNARIMSIRRPSSNAHRPESAPRTCSTARVSPDNEHEQRKPMTVPKVPNK
jgi:hypothetical protein